MSLHLGSIAPNFVQGSTRGTIVPSLTDPKELAVRFPGGFRTVKPYLRLVPQPNR